MADGTYIDNLISKYAREFEPVPVYSESGDCVEWYFENTDNYAERVDCWLTVFREFETKRIIGFMLKNIKTLQSAFDRLGIVVHARGDKYNIKVYDLVSHVPWVEPESAKNDSYRSLMGRLRDNTSETIRLIPA